MTYLSRPVVTAVIVALIVTTAAWGAENLLENPGFESGQFEPLPEPWAAHGGDPPKLDRQMSDDAHSGDRSVLLIDEAAGVRAGDLGTGLFQKLPAEPGTFYKASCRAKCLQRDRDNAAWLQIWFEPSGKRFNMYLNTSENNVWEQFSVIGRAPDDTTSVRVYVKTLHLAASRYLVDDMSLEKMELDEQQLPLLEYGAQGIDQVRQLNLVTPITENGQAVSHICVPEGEKWQQLGGRLSRALEEKTGATVPLVPPGWDALKSEETTIAIGNLNNNFILERMWLNRYQRVDSLHPGPGAYILQNIPEPHDCPKGKNVFIIGASDAEGAQTGLDALLERLEGDENLSIDGWVLEISNHEPMSEKQRQELLDRDLSKYWLKDFWKAAQRYQQRGDIAYAMRAKKILMACAKRYRDFARDPDADLLEYWPAPTSSKGKRTHIYWPEETTSEWIGSMWDFLEECPVFTDEERKTSTNALLMVVHGLKDCTYYWSSLEKRETTEAVQHNHTTYPALGMYFLARYYQRFYGNVDGRMDDYLQRVDNCFSAQMNSWKPKEDATGYYSTVPGHTITYSLAEGDYSYFDSGRVKTLCDYTMAICDNTGDPASFGDNGYGRGIYTRNLDWAVWYYDDANVVWWLQHVTDWKNPFKKIEPEPWEQMVGLTTFDLTESVYDWTGSKFESPNVPYEKCFDKIAFRENLDPDGQFFLLDGYSRGGHLHYDGNAIIKFFADGEDWLIDGDYLVRNTTDHNMLSLTRDGRCSEYEPVCSALEHMADLPDAKLTQTSVYDYNGADWDRNILWLPGDFVCLLDRVTAAEAGEFNCEIIFKMMDNGELGGDGERVVSLRRMAGGRPGKHGLDVVENPSEDVEAAVKFADNFSRLDFPVTLPEGGPYRVHIIGYGLDGGTDSFWVQADGGDRHAFHLPLGKFSRSYDSGVNPKVGSSPKMPIEAGEHLITITLRESPNVMLDKVEFVDQDDNVIEVVEAEKAPEIPEQMLADTPPDRLFFIKNDGHSRTVQSTRFNHERIPIRYAHHKFTGVLETGEAISNQALFFNTDERENADFDLRRLNRDACLLTSDGDPLGVFAAAPDAIDLPDATATDAPMGFFGEDFVVVTDAAKLGAITADMPVDMQVDFRTEALTVRSEEPAQMQVGGKTHGVEREEEIDLKGTEIPATMRRAWQPALERIAKSTMQKPAEGEEKPPTGENIAAAWTVEAIEYEGSLQNVTEMKARDIDGDGADEILALRGRFLSCIDDDGTPMWEFDGNAELYSVSSFDTDESGSHEIFVGGKDKHLYMLSADGDLLHDHPIETYLRATRTTIHEPRLDDVLVRDYDGDGDWEAGIGTVDGFTQMIDHNFEQQWIFGETNHGTTEFEALDCNGDGVLDLVVGNRYGKMFVFDIKTGDALAYVRSELGDCQITAADLDGDGTVELMNGSATGAFVCEDFDSGETEWTFPNYGYRVRDIQAADFTGDEKREVAVASDTQYVYILSASGETLSKRNLHSAVLNLAVVPTDEGTLLAAGCLDGMVYLLDGSLDILGQFPTGSQVNWVEPTGQGASVVAGTEDGRVIGVQMQ